MNTIALAKHTKYRVRFRADGTRRDREMVGTYLGEGPPGCHAFDLRGARAGTITLPARCILDARVVHGATPHQTPQRLP